MTQWNADVLCIECSISEKRDRMKVCETCAKEESRLHPYTICGLCTFDHHNDHSIVSYAEYQLSEIYSTATHAPGAPLRGHAHVTSVDDRCLKESSAAKQNLKDWKEELQNMRLVKCSNNSERSSLVDFLVKETTAIGVTRSACHAPLKKYKKRLQKSIRKLKEYRSNQVNGRKSIETVDISGDESDSSDADESQLGYDSDASQKSTV